MSSRNAFTTSYIYHQGAVRHIHKEMEAVGYGIKTNKGLNDDFQVVGMIKNVEMNFKFQQQMYNLLKETKKMFNIGYPLSAVFIGDENNVITFITTDEQEWEFREY